MSRSSFFLAIAALFVVALIAVPLAQAWEYQVVYRSAWVHDDDAPNYNPPPIGTVVDIDCNWYNPGTGYTDASGKAEFIFHDYYVWPDSPYWTTTVSINWIPVDPPTNPQVITTGPEVLEHNHIWDGDWEE